MLQRTERGMSPAIVAPMHATSARYSSAARYRRWNMTGEM